MPISTDGGSLPRNVSIRRTFALVAFGALSPLEAADKLSYRPSRALGLLDKGHFSEGADADVTIVDRSTGAASMSLVAGEPIMIDGKAVGNRRNLAGDRQRRRDGAGERSTPPGDRPWTVKAVRGLVNTRGSLNSGTGAMQRPRGTPTRSTRRLHSSMRKSKEARARCSGPGNHNSLQQPPRQFNAQAKKGVGHA